MRKQEDIFKLVIPALIAAWVFFVVPSTWLSAAGAPAPTAKSGREIYNAVCESCHGLDGKGGGPVAAYLQTKPRDFTKGIFKFRSTPSGQLPTDQDLYRTITSGVHTAAMPSFKMLSPEDRAEAIDYIKTFSPRFSDPKEYPLTPIKVGTPIPYSRESVAEGRKVYVEMKCNQCHGNSGRGNGPSAKGLTDVWDHRIQPRDLTKAHASKLAADPTEIYRTFSTGLDGTPMPSFADSLTEEQRWNLANYVYSLQRKDEYYEWFMPGK